MSVVGPCGDPALVPEVEARAVEVDGVMRVEIAVTSAPYCWRMRSWWNPAAALAVAADIVAAADACAPSGAAAGESQPGPDLVAMVARALREARQAARGTAGPLLLSDDRTAAIELLDRLHDAGALIDDETHAFCVTAGQYEDALTAATQAKERLDGLETSIRAEADYVIERDGRYSGAAVSRILRALLADTGVAGEPESEDPDA